MPSPSLLKNIKWYESYWMRRYKSKYAPAPMFESDKAIRKDAFNAIRSSKRSDDDKKTMIADIKYFGMRWGKVFAELNLMTTDPKLNEKVLEVLMPKLVKETKDRDRKSVV